MKPYQFLIILLIGATFAMASQESLLRTLNDESSPNTNAQQPPDEKPRPDAQSSQGAQPPSDAQPPPDEKPDSDVKPPSMPIKPDNTENQEPIADYIQYVDSVTNAYWGDPFGDKYRKTIQPLYDQLNTATDKETQKAIYQQINKLYDDLNYPFTYPRCVEGKTVKVSFIARANSISMFLSNQQKYWSGWDLENTISEDFTFQWEVSQVYKQTQTRDPCFIDEKIQKIQQEFNEQVWPSVTNDYGFNVPKPYFFDQIFPNIYEQLYNYFPPMMVDKPAEDDVNSASDDTATSNSSESPTSNTGKRLLIDPSKEDINSNPAPVPNEVDQYTTELEDFRKGLATHNVKLDQQTIEIPYELFKDGFGYYLTLIVTHKETNLRGKAQVQAVIIQEANYKDAENLATLTVDPNQIDLDHINDDISVSFNVESEDITSQFGTTKKASLTVQNSFYDYEPYWFLFDNQPQLLNPDFYQQNPEKDYNDQIEKQLEMYREKWDSFIKGEGPLQFPPEIWTLYDLEERIFNLLTELRDHSQNIQEKINTLTTLVESNDYQAPGSEVELDLVVRLQAVKSYLATEKGILITNKITAGENQAAFDELLKQKRGCIKEQDFVNANTLNALLALLTKNRKDLSKLSADIDAFIGGTATEKLNLPPALRFPNLKAELDMWKDFLAHPANQKYEAKRVNQFLSEVRWAIWYRVGYTYVDILGQERNNQNFKKEQDQAISNASNAQNRPSTSMPSNQIKPSESGKQNDDVASDSGPNASNSSSANKEQNGSNQSNLPPGVKPPHDPSGNQNKNSFQGAANGNLPSGGRRLLQTDSARAPQYWNAVTGIITSEKSARYFRQINYLQSIKFKSPKFYGSDILLFVQLKGYTDRDKEYRVIKGLHVAGFELDQLKLPIDFGKYSYLKFYYPMEAATINSLPKDQQKEQVKSMSSNALNDFAQNAFGQSSSNSAPVLPNTSDKTEDAVAGGQGSNGNQQKQTKCGISAIPCNGKGNCLNNVCSCNQGWTGRECSTEAKDLEQKQNVQQLVLDALNSKLQNTEISTDEAEQLKSTAKSVLKQDTLTPEQIASGTQLMSKTLDLGPVNDQEFKDYLDIASNLLNLDQASQTKTPSKQIEMKKFIDKLGSKLVDSVDDSTPQKEQSNGDFVVGYSKVKTGESLSYQMQTPLGSTTPPKVTLPASIPGANGLGVAQMSLNTVDSVITNQKVISNPISVVVYDQNNEPLPVSGLKTPITLELEVTSSSTLNTDNVAAQFIDETTGKWNTEGCKVVGVSGNKVTIEVSHTTVFSVAEKEKTNAGPDGLSEDSSVLVLPLGIILGLINLSI